MECPDYNSPSALRSFMEENGMAMQKKFGQNFMVNPAARARIADMLELREGERVWEVGPGLGCMTSELLARGAAVTAFEIDRGFAAVLERLFAGAAASGRFVLVPGDVLKTWPPAARGGTEGVKLAGNLPYNIAAALVGDTVARGAVFERCALTVQREVADRMCARPGGRDYSAFSVLCQWRYEVRPGMELAPGNFWPRPRVDSRAVLLVRRRDAPPCADGAAFVRMVHALFSSRRKTLANNIRAALPPGADATRVLARAGVDGGLRAECLSLEDFLRLAESAIMEA